VSYGTGLRVPNSPTLSVFLLIRSLDIGGAERQIVELARGLRKRGHRVTVAVFYSPAPLEVELRQAGIRVVDLRKTGRWDTFGFVRRLRAGIRNANPDVVYSFLGGANIFAAAVRPFTRDSKLVWSIRASDMDLGHYDWGHRLAYEFERRLSHTASLIISNSHAGKEFAVANGFPERRIAVVPTGIDTNYFRPDTSLRTAQRIAWGISDREIAVGVLARLDPMKGHADFLHAAARVARIRDDVRFLCVGDGVEEARLKHMAAHLGISDRVLFAGPTHDPVAALNGLDLFCSASVWGEGFSNSIAEAMACGLRCVVTDVGDSALIVGDCGQVVPRSTPDALADAILQQLETLGDGELSQGRARIVEEFSTAAMVDRTVALLQRVTN
jgi:glycosyltransferase involved in cell wall biosynthesis